MAHDVFLSYASANKPIADGVCAHLEAEGIRVWIAPRDVLPGMNYGEAIIEGINSSRLVVIVFSASSNGSPQVLREVERAVSKGIGIIPFRVEDVKPSKSMEYFLSSPHWLDAIDPPLERHIQSLIATVKTLLKHEPAASGASPAPTVGSAAESPAKHKDESLDGLSRSGGIFGRILSIFDDK
jgi:hypothetical protein